MKGTDVSDLDITQAEGFLKIAGKRNPPISREQKIAITYGQLVQLLAWYGRIRSGGKEAPGECYIAGSEADRP